MIERTIAASTHGRYLVQPPAASGPAPLLVGFHGYAEGAEAQLDRMRAISGADRWRIVSIQGLNRFYQRRTNEVIAGWMTRQDRDLAIADNAAYVAAVVEAVQREWPGSPRVIFAGFSQGVAMAFRAAASARAVDGVIAVGGDVPPEISPPALGRIPSALVCRGARDEWYAPATFETDVKRLREAGTIVEPLQFDGGHEWSDAVAQAAGRFLRERLT
ncbi:MAG: acetylxylan esterase [Acidobacteriia bacterium]|nr:acetylxylan esterase [Terriglobia bacterium]